MDREKKSSDIDQIEEVKHSKSVFADPFFAPLLAVGTIPGENKIPEQLLKAMAILIGRTVEDYVDPTDCAGAAALVALALGLDLQQVPQITREPPASTMRILDRYKQKNLSDPQEVEGLNVA